MKNTVLTFASLFALTSGFLIGAPAVASGDGGLTAYEQGLVCKLSGTCDNSSTNSGASDEASSRDVGREATFAVFRGGNTKVATPAAPAAPSQYSSKGRSNGPIYYGAGGKAVKGSGASSGGDAHHSPAYVKGASSAVEAGRANAADVRVLFANGSTELNAHGISEISHFAHALQSPALSSKNFIVEGHTNSVGARDYNLDLSQRRAQAVVDYLIKQGVAASRLQAKGYGFDKPRNADSKAAGNRRVEIVTAD